MTSMETMTPREQPAAEIRERIGLGNIREGD